MKRLIGILLGALVIATALPAHSAISPIAVAIVPPVQFPGNEFSITGLRLSLIYGHQRDVFGLDLGAIGNITDQDFTGVGVSGLFNITHGTTKIIFLQAAGAANWNSQKTEVYGIQAALGINYNEAASSLVGLEIAAVNNSPNMSIYGVQAGVYNKALHVYGFQIGLVNVANDLHGIQIGLVNFNRTGLFSVAPILNVGF